MAVNSNGNVYPFLILTYDLQIFGVDSQQQKHQLSDKDFALDFGISEDGTIWVISTTPDPDGGGARIFWSKGDKKWTEVATPDPGGIKISGGPGSSAYYITGEGDIYEVDKNTAPSRWDDSNYYIMMDYGGGYIWTLHKLPAGSGGHEPGLYFKKLGGDWQSFVREEDPYSISVNNQGNCFCVNGQGNPVYFSTDGLTTGSAGTGIDGKAMQISNKDWSYVLSTDVTEEGNLIYVWETTGQGTFTATSVRANKVLSTYYSDPS